MSGNSSCHVVTSGLVRQGRGAASRGPPVGVLACNAVEGQATPRGALSWDRDGIQRCVGCRSVWQANRSCDDTRVAASRGPTEHSL
jgi:hypothetical protein